MANSKIEAKVKFTESGAEQTAKKVDKLKNSSNKASDVIGQLNKKLDKIGKAAGISATIDSIKAVGSAVSSVKNLVGGAASSLYGFLNGQASTGDNIAKLSRSLGFASSEFEKFQYAANRGGVSSEEFTNNMKKFTQGVAKAAAGEKNMKDLFNAMGISVKKRNGQMKSTASLMLEVADVYTKLTNAQDRSRVSAELFGRSAVKMSTMLEGGSKGLKELLDRREKLGGLLSPEDTKNAEDFEDKVLDVSKAFESVKRKVAYGVMPSVNRLLDRILSWWSGNGKRILERVNTWTDKVSVYVDSIADRIPDIANSLGSTFNVVAGLVNEFGVGNTAVAALASGITLTVVPALAAASAAAGALGVSLGAILPIMVGVSGLAVGIKEVIENWDLLMDASWKDWKYVLNSFSEWFWELDEQITTGLVNGLKSVLDWLWKIDKIVGDIMLKWIKFPFQEIISIWSGGPKIDFGTSKNEMDLGVIPQQSVSRRVDNIPQERDPAGVPVMRQYSESKSTTTNRLQVDFTGMQKGMTVTPGPNFDSSVIDYTAGYVFGN